MAVPRCSHVGVVGHAAAGESPDVLGLDAGATLRRIKAERAEASTAAELRAVAHWCDVHRTHGVIGSIDRDTEEMLGLAPGAAPGAVTGLAQSHSLLGREGDLRLLGEGAFRVEEADPPGGRRGDPAPRPGPGPGARRGGGAAERRGVWVEVDGPDLTGTGTGTGPAPGPAPGPAWGSGRSPR